MAKSLFEILQEQADIADKLAVAAQKAAPRIPVMQVAEIPRWVPEIPMIQLPEIPELEPIIPEMAKAHIYKPAVPTGYIKTRAAEALRPKRTKFAKPNPYVGQYFKLQEFHILTRYKNLDDWHIDFRDTTSYCTFIGLNGSGKSNVIEAISAVFYSLYRLASLKSPKKTDHCPFDYQISYIHNEHLVEVENGKTKDGKKVTEDILPKNVIVNYSGEENRLWRQYYEPIYSKFCSKLTDESQRF